MKRNLKISILAIITIFALIVPVVPVFATEPSIDIVQLGDNKYATFEEALSNVTAENNKIVLLDDVALSGTVQVTKDVTIDLNGHKITAVNRLFMVQGCTFTVTGKGSLEETAPDYAPIVIKGSNNVADKKYTVVNVDKDVTLSGWSGVFVTPYKASGAPYAYGVEINLNGTINAQRDSGKADGNTIYINGQIQHLENAPVVNISETAKLNNFGIYAAGYATWNINGANISGENAGIALKSGVFNIENATISSTGEDNTPTEGWSNGVNASGTAIQVESNKGYAGNIVLNIKNSKLVSKNSFALYEYLDSKTTETTLKSLKIENSDFVSAAGKGNIKVSEKFGDKFTKFLTDGTYSADVTDYIADGLVCKKVGDVYVVGKENAIKLAVEPTEGGTLTADLEKAVRGEIVSIVTAVKEGYELKEVTAKDASNKAIEVKDGKFVMPDSEVTVTATFSKLTQVVEVPTIDPTEEVKTPTVGVTDKEKVNDVLLGALNDVAKEDKELKEILETKNVEVVVDLRDVEIDEELQKEIDTILKESEENVSIAKFFDISLVIKADGDNVGSLTELEKPVEFTIALPTDLQNVASGVKRVFYIVREHEGKYDLLETTMSEDGKFLTFESDKFSLYTLAYVDVKEGNGNGNNGDNGNTGSEDNKGNEENKDNSGNTQNQEKTDTPKTGDIVLPIFTGIAVISVAGIVFFAVKNKKNRK